MVVSMKIFPPALEIADDEGFAPEKDLFGRKPLGEGLRNLMGAVSQPIVMALDAQWGAGKTTFLRMWAGELRNAGHPVIFFDAFENDHTSDAFLAISAAIVEIVQAHKKSSTKPAKEFLHKAIGAGKVLARSGLKLGVKAATLGAVNATDLDELAEAISDEAETLFDKHIGEKLTQQKAERSALEAFRDALRVVPSILAPPSDGEPQKALVFIIDELDRCKPSFALEILERIKHFFAVENVHFVLGVHMAQLRNSVAAAYGSQIDAHNYLQKFINISYFLIDEGRYRHDRVVPRYVEYLTKSLEFDPENRESARYTAEFISAVSDAKDFSLRSVERIFTALALALAFTGQSQLRPAPIIGGLCVLRVTHPSLYAKAKMGTLTYAEVDGALGLGRNDEDYNMEFARDWWTFCLEPDAPDELVKKFGSTLFQYGFRDRMHIVPALANVIVDRLSS